MECEFLNPVNFLGEAPTTSTEIWNFKNLNCSSTLFAQIQNPDTGAEFYVQKTLTYGEAIEIWFLTMFSFYVIFTAVYKFFWRK
jgi:hypothetical protein